MTVQSVLLVGYVLRHLFVPHVVPSTVPQTTPQTGGELSVSVWEERQSGAVPRGATRVHFLTLKLAASCDADITVDHIDLKHIGLGRSSDITGVYAVAGYRRLSRSVSFSTSDQIASLRLRAFKIAKCDVAKVEILADMSPDADIAGEHAMQLTGPSGFSTSAKTVTIEDNPDRVRVITSPETAGAIDVEFIPLHTRLSYGKLMTVARMQITADDKTDHVLRRITLTNNGSARNFDLLRLYLETSAGQQVTNVAPNMDRNTVTLNFDPPFHLERSQTRLLLLKAEVRASVTRTVSFTLLEDGDLQAVPWKGRN